MSALTKVDIAKVLNEKHGLSNPEAKEIIDCFFEEIRLALESGRHCRLSGFGNFELRDKPERPGRNPKTGEEVKVSARRVVTFKPSPKLRAAIETLSSEVLVDNERADLGYSDQ